MMVMGRLGVADEDAVVELDADSTVDCGQIDHVAVFAQKPTKMKNGKCDGSGLDAHTGDCVKKANQQRVREEMVPALQIPSHAT